MAGESYSLDEVSALLGVPVPDLVRRIEEGAFPGRFLTSDWEMRIPVRDVQRAVEQMRRSGTTRAMVPSEPAVGQALMDPGSLREALDAWWEEREARLLVEIRELRNRDDQRWEAVEELLVEVRDRLTQLESEAPAGAWAVDAEGWLSGIGESGDASASTDSIFAELRDLERLLGLGDGDGAGGANG